MFPGPIKSRKAARIRMVAKAAGQGHRAGARCWPACADGHVGGILEHRPDQERSGLGRVGAVAVGQYEDIKITQGRKCRPHRVPLALLGDSDDPHSEPASDLAGAVGRVVIEHDKLGLPAAPPRNCAITVAIAAASLKHGMATAIRAGSWLGLGGIRHGR